jgi:effector-binding domain-containing protein
MFTEPRLEERSAQHYVGIRRRVPMQELPTFIPQSIGEVFGWLEKKGIPPKGAPFLRFHVIDMQAAMDVELGVPVDGPVPGEDGVQPGLIPAGRYAALVYTGVQNGIPGNARLLEWGKNRGLVWDRWDDVHGDAFGARYETFLTGPDDDPDPANWKTDVAIRVADGKS